MDEYDAFSTFRRFIYWKDSQIKKIQRGYRKRVRRWMKDKLQEGLGDG